MSKFICNWELKKYTGTKTCTLCFTLLNFRKSVGTLYQKKRQKVNSTMGKSHCCSYKGQLSETTVKTQHYLFVCLVVLTSGYWCRHHCKVCKDSIFHSLPYKILSVPFQSHLGLIDRTKYAEVPLKWKHRTQSSSSWLAMANSSTE